MVIEAITDSMTGFAVPASARNELFRSRMVQFMLLTALVLNPLPEAVVDRIDRAPPLLAQHDWVHVLAEYGSTVESESKCSRSSPAPTTIREPSPYWRKS